MVLRSDHAVLIYLWSDDPRTANWLRQQLDQALRARSRRVLHETVADDDGFRGALNTVLAPPSGCENFAVWVSLPAAAAAIPLADHWLARVNERRLQLLQWPRAVIVCGPTGYEARAGEVAPDLWSVRSDSLALPAWVIADAPAAPLPASAGAGPGDSEPPAAMLALWRAAWQSAGGGSAGQAKRLDIGLGLSTAQRLLMHRQLADAREVIDQVGTALLELPAPVDRTVLRQRLHQQQLLGDWFSLQRQWPAALAASQSALASSGELLKLTGESPESLLDLAIALERLGDVSQAQGEAGAALGYFKRDLIAAQAALRQSPLSQDIQDVVRTAQARIASLPPDTP